MPAGSKWCADCDRVLPLEEFVRTVPSGTGRGSYCKTCHNARGRAAKEKVGGSRTYHLTRRYGITAAEADHMLRKQDEVCAICRTAPAAHFDHDPEVLRAAADYVAFHTLRQYMVRAFAAAGLGPVRPVRVR